MSELLRTDTLLAFVVGGGLMGLLDWFLKRRTNAVEVKRSEVDRLCVLIKHLQEDNERLRRNLRDVEERVQVRGAAQEREIMGLRMGILVLIEQLRELGVQPRWAPDVEGGVG
jgi:hypothetical protein